MILVTLFSLLKKRKTVFQICCIGLVREGAELDQPIMFSSGKLFVSNSDNVRRLLSLNIVIGRLEGCIL